MNILIYHYGALGDFITALPSFRFFKNRYCGTVTLLGKREYGTLALQSEYVDTILDADSSRHRFVFSPLTASGELQSFFGQFKVVVLFAGKDATISENARKNYCGKLYFPPPTPPSHRHAIDRHFDLFPEEKLLPEDVPRIAVPAVSSGGRITEAFFREHHPYIVIHPGSGSPQKNWPFEHFTKVASTIRNSGYTIVWLAGPADRQTGFPESDIHFSRLSLPECTLLLEHSSAYLGNDSGITHLAAATGTNVAAIFGPSDPALWAPRGTGAITVLHHPPAEGCSPCHLQTTGKRHSCNHSCMQQVTVEEVLETLTSLTGTDIT